MRDLMVKKKKSKVKKDQDEAIKLLIAEKIRDHMRKIERQ